MDVGALQGWRHLHPLDLLADPEKGYNELRDLLNENDLEAVAFNAGFSAPETDQLSALVSLADQFAVRVITLPSLGADKPISQEVERMKRLVEIADGKGVRLGVETHVGTLTENPETALELVRSVPGLGLTLDVSHYYCNGFEKAAETLLPYVYHVHVRDCGRTTENIELPFGEGLCDFEHWFNLLHHAQYAGNVTVEYIDLPGIRFDHVDSALRCFQACQTFVGGSES